MIAPELEPFTVDLAGLVPYPGNARRGDLDAITASLKVNGQFRPIVVNRGTLTGRPNEVLAGNHTLEAARALGWPRIAVTWLDVDDTAARAVVLADNGTTRHATYDTDALVALLQAQPDLEGTGWQAPDLAALLAELNPTVPVALVDPDDVPGLPTATISQPGSVWRLGPHLLLCGDATDPAAYQRLADLGGGEPVDCVFTDPPYGVAYVGGTADRMTIKNDRLGADGTEQLARDAFTAALVACRPGAVWYVATPAGPKMLPFAKVLSDLGVWRQTVVWVKDRFVLGHIDYHYRHELLLTSEADLPVPEAHESIMMGYTPGAEGRQGRGSGAGWYGDNAQDTVWEVPRPSASREHPTMKPTELIARALRNSTKPGDLVLDPFAGSGSTMVAAHLEGRVARMIELDPHYADVICRRWQQLTGVTPTDAATGADVDFTLES